MITELRREGDDLILYGDGFNAFSQVEQNGHALDTVYVSDHQLMVEYDAEAGDVFVVCQVQRDGLEVIAQSNEIMLE